MGGDYQKVVNMEPCFPHCTRKNTDGHLWVMGNNDYERYTTGFRIQFKHYGMRPLEQEVDTLRKDGQQIIIAGVRNPFDLGRNGVSPTSGNFSQRFCHLTCSHRVTSKMFQYANRPCPAGHTHGGQVRVFGVAPALNSHYGNRFITGLAYNSAKIPLIITNGIGTSKLPIPCYAPAEIIVITLHRLTE